MYRFVILFTLFHGYISLKYFVVNDEFNYARYTLYTPENPKGTNFSTERNYTPIVHNSNREYKILIHGTAMDSSTFWYENMTSEYLKTKNFNVITTKFYISPFFYRVTERDLIVCGGKSLASFMIELNKNYSINFDKFHLIGHGIGSAIAGYAGLNIILKTGEKIGRITGLDPIYIPKLYKNYISDNNFDRNNAKFVDNIYPTTTLSDILPSGHINFYPQILDCQYIKMCEHYVTVKIFTESINNEIFLAKKCNDFVDFWDVCNDYGVAHLGEHVEKNLSGVYLLRPDRKYAEGILENKNLFEKGTIYRIRLSKANTLEPYL